MALNESTGTIGGVGLQPAGEFAANHKFYERKFLETLQPAEMYHLWGNMVSVPANNSNTISYQKIADLPDLETAPLTEGVTPTEQTTTVTRIEKSVSQYGGYMRTTDRLVEEGLDGVTLEFSKKLGYQGARTMNKVRRDGLLGGSSVRYQGAAVGGRDGITTQFDGATDLAGDMAFILTAFRNNKVRPFAPLHGGSPNETTTVLPNAYPVVVPVEAVDLIRTAPDFKEVEQYGGQVALMHPQEFGAYRNFRFIYDTEVATVTNGPGDTIAQCLVFGQGDMDKAYVTVDLAGGNMKMITKPLGSSGSVDPLDQRASMGWKAKQATFIVQQDYIWRWEIKIDAT